MAAEEHKPSVAQADEQNDAPESREPEAGGAGAAPAEADALEQDVEELIAKAAERDEYLALAQRTQADFENFRKRAAKDMAASGARAKAGLIRELLPVVDNLERALGAVEGSDDGVSQGLKLVYAELEGVLTRNGVQ